MNKKLPIFYLFLFFLNFGFSQETLIVYINENKDLHQNFFINNNFNVKKTFNLPNDRLDKLKQDAIKVSGTDNSIKKLQNYFTISPSNEFLQNYLRNNNLSFSVYNNIPIPPPTDIMPVTPNFFSQQTYLQANPGLNVEAVWSLGYNGQNIKIHNIEYGFNKNHEELNHTNCSIAPNMTVNSSASIDYTEHGTATLGVLFADNGTYGVTGIAYGAQQVLLYPEWQQSGYSRTNAINEALLNSSVGDIIVYEMQAYGYNGTFSNPRFVPAEYDQLVWDLTKALTDSGRIVVAAAGNGFQDLDSSDYLAYMNYGDSGAIIVGAGTDNTNHSIFSYVSGGVTYGSTYGSKVDVQGWYLNVRTTGNIPGYGATLIGNDTNQSYMNFAGTSSATAQVAGAVAVIQSYFKATTNSWLTSQQMRTVLKNTGIPQGGDLTKNIGPLPNMLEAVNYINQNLNATEINQVEFNIYPNPSNGVFNIVVNDFKNLKIEVVDILGKNIYFKSYNQDNNTSQIDLTTFENGIYFLKISTNEFTSIKRIIKN